MKTLFAVLHGLTQLANMAKLTPCKTIACEDQACYTVRDIQIGSLFSYFIAQCSCLFGSWFCILRL